MLGAPASAEDVSISGDGCVLTNGGRCAASLGYPTENYGDDEQCQISHVPLVPLQVILFDVPEIWVHTYDDSFDCHHDRLSLSGLVFCGDRGPEGVVPTDGVISWLTNPHGITGR